MKKILITLCCLCIAHMSVAKNCPSNIEIKVNEAGIGSIGKTTWFSTSFIAKNSRVGKLVFVVGTSDKTNPSVLSQLICQYKIHNDSKTHATPVTPVTSGKNAVPNTAENYILAYVDQDAKATIDNPSIWNDFKVDKVISKFCIPAGDAKTCAFTFKE